MAHYISEHGRDKTRDEFGNPIRPAVDVDPVHHGGVATGHGSPDRRHTTGTGNNGTHGRATGPTGFAATTAGGHGVLHHRRFSPNSSSEDEKGLKEKLQGANSDQSGATQSPLYDVTAGHEKKDTIGAIKVQLPCTNSDPNVATNTPPYDVTTEHEKKGMMDTIEEKLPGANNDHSGTTNTPPNDVTTGHEKKSIMEKIKEKPPEHH